MVENVMGEEVISMEKMNWSTGELLTMIDLCGYSTTAEGMGESIYPNRTKFFWGDFFEKSVESLIAKEYLSKEKYTEGDNPLTPKLQQFIEEYMQAKRVIRAAKRGTDETFIIRELGDGTWMRESIISKEALHRFDFSDHLDLKQELKEFYQYAPTSPQVYASSFQITDAQFAMLNQKRNGRSVRDEASFSTEERASFDHFIKDLKKKNGVLNSISLLRFEPEYNELHLEKVIFHLPSDEGVWVIHYQNAETVHVSLQISNEWLHMIDFTSYMIGGGDVV
ncbi:hypothetical protein RYX56_01170 [Alkalihalophilus lindianensis]|uniref:Uncharacterized protein n=1 Tax=Alkalihalophilus lindianensis TaxID=1630542 RepID=A0ABU3X520_9BACI|nr:hypothetical protein [Alkalihalophilus lindianensis]MDV2682977.1 hypothetical protein [Alkalihalophilus lindianensis]